MNIYHIERNIECGYDEVAEVVVVAESEGRARSLFVEQKGVGEGPADEGAAAWLTPDSTRCNLIGVALNDTERVVVRHFAAS